MNASEQLEVKESGRDYLKYRLKPKAIKEYYITIDEFLSPCSGIQFKKFLDIHFDVQNSKYQSKVFRNIYALLMAAYRNKYAADLKVDIIEKFCAFILKYDVAAPNHVRKFTENLIEISTDHFKNTQTIMELSLREPNVDIRKYLLTNIGTRHELLFSLLEFYFDLTDHLNVFATIDCVNFENTFIGEVPLYNPVELIRCLGIKFDQLVPVVLLNDTAGAFDVYRSPEGFTEIIGDRLNNELDTKNDFMRFFRNGDIMDKNNISVAMMMNNNSIQTISPEIVANEQTLIFIDRIFISPEKESYNNYRSLRLPAVLFNKIPAAAFDFYSEELAKYRCI